MVHENVSRAASAYQSVVRACKAQASPIRIEQGRSVRAQLVAEILERVATALQSGDIYVTEKAIVVHDGERWRTVVMHRDIDAIPE